MSRAFARKRRRFWLVSLVLLSLGGATALALTAFEDNLLFFYSPSDLVERPIEPGRAFRLGGLVEDGSVSRDAQARVLFRVTDGAQAVPVVYAGLLPDLFREGQGVVTQGAMGEDGVFMAREVLARHDENYMPSEVADALKRAGHWQHAGEDGTTAEAAP